MYDVVFHNDDVTTMDFVVYVLMTYFSKSADDAETLMLKVDREGSAVVGTYYLDIAESKKEKTITLARKMNFPLQVTVGEHK